MVAQMELRIIAITQPAQSFITETGINPRKLEGSRVDQQVKNLLDHSLMENNPSGGQVVYVLFNGTKEQVLKAAKKTMKGSNRNNAEKLFRSLTLIAPDADKPSDIKDPTTGIRIRDIKKGEIRFTTHPTPDS